MDWVVSSDLVVLNTLVFGIVLLVQLLEDLHRLLDAERFFGAHFLALDLLLVLYLLIGVELERHLLAFGRWWKPFRRGPVGELVDF
jgi:hypothetical protein